MVSAIFCFFSVILNVVEKSHFSTSIVAIVAAIVAIKKDLS